MASTAAPANIRHASRRHVKSDGTYDKEGSSYKRIIVCCDGTWQGSDNAKVTVPSNVARFVKALAPKATDGEDETQQIIYYQSGVGTDLLSGLGTVAAGATGAGLDQNVLEAYYFISNNYEVDDEIFLFGFSRGAYTVRTLAGLLDEFDIIDKHSMNLFPEWYNAYQIRNQKNSKELGELYDAKSEKLDDNSFELLDGVRKKGKIPKYLAKIKVIGVWDTVGSMGIPENSVVRSLDLNRRQKFRDPGLSMKVENAFHAVALDEHRQPFTPTMWHTPEETWHSGIYTGPNLIQCWFPGVHINIGGGSSDNRIPPDVAKMDAPAPDAPKPPSPSDWVTKNRGWWSSVTSTVSSGLSKINIFAPSPVKGNDGKHYIANTDNEELADITLMWMVDRCRPFLEFEQSYLDMVVEEHAKKVTMKRPKAMSLINPSRLFSKPPPLTFGYACGPILDSFSGVMMLAGSQPRTPGQYTSGNLIDPTKDSHHTNEYMHPSVRWRYYNNEDEYKNARGLDGFWLANYTGAKDSPVQHDGSTTGMVWEKKVPKPAEGSGKIIRVSEFKINEEISVGSKGKKVKSEEVRLMGDDIYEKLKNPKNPHGFDQPIKGKVWFQD